MCLAASLDFTLSTEAVLRPVLFVSKCEASAAPASVSIDDSKGDAACAGLTANCKTLPLSFRGLDRHNVVTAGSRKAYGLHFMVKWCKKTLTLVMGM